MKLRDIQTIRSTSNEQIFDMFLDMIKNCPNKDIIDFIEKLSPNQIHMKDKFGRTLYFYAVVAQRTTITIELLKKGADDYILDIYQVEPISANKMFPHLMGRYSDHNTFKIYGESLTYREKLLSNPIFSKLFYKLESAVKNQDLKEVESCLEAGKQAGFHFFQCIQFEKDNGAVFRESAEKDIRIFSALIDAGYFYNEIVDGEDAHFYYGSKRHGWVVKPIKDYSCFKVIEWAAQGRLDLLKICIPKLFSPNIRIYEKRVDGTMFPGHGTPLACTILEIAAQSGHLNVVQFLLESGADPNPLLYAEYSEICQESTQKVKTTAVLSAIVGLALQLQAAVKLQLDGPDQMIATLAGDTYHKICKTYQEMIYLLLDHHADPFFSLEQSEYWYPKQMRITAKKNEMAGNIQVGVPIFSDIKDLQPTFFEWAQDILNPVIVEYVNKQRASEDTKHPSL